MNRKLDMKWVENNCMKLSLYCCAIVCVCVCVAINAVNIKKKWHMSGGKQKEQWGILNVTAIRYSNGIIIYTRPHISSDFSFFINSLQAPVHTQTLFTLLHFQLKYSMLLNHFYASKIGTFFPTNEISSFNISWAIPERIDLCHNCL